MEIEESENTITGHSENVDEKFLLPFSQMKIKILRQLTR